MLYKQAIQLQASAKAIDSPLSSIQTSLSRQVRDEPFLELPPGKKGQRTCLDSRRKEYLTEQKKQLDATTEAEQSHQRQERATSQSFPRAGSSMRFRPWIEI
ncbi:uncharacterized protein V6R79_013637 [Siganus canaliculatus]